MDAHVKLCKISKQLTIEEFKAKFKVGDALFVGDYNSLARTRGIITAIGEKAFLYTIEEKNKHSYQHEAIGSIPRAWGWLPYE